MSYLENTKFYITKAHVKANPTKANIQNNNMVSLNDIIDNISDEFAKGNLKDYLPINVVTDTSVARAFTNALTGAVSWLEVAPGMYAMVMSVANSGDPTDTNYILISETDVIIAATDDFTDHYSEVRAQDLKVQLSYTKVGGGNTTLSLAEDTIGINTEGTGTTTIDTGHLVLDIDSNTNVVNRTVLVADSSTKEVFHQAYIDKSNHSSTGNIAASLSDKLIKGTAAGANITLTLPVANDVIGTKYYIFNDASSTHNVLIDGDGSEKINGNNAAPATIQPGRGLVFLAWGAGEWFCSFI